MQSLENYEISYIQEIILTQLNSFYVCLVKDISAIVRVEKVLGHFFFFFCEG